MDLGSSAQQIFVRVNVWRWLIGVSLATSVVRGSGIAARLDLPLTALQFGFLAIALLALWVAPSTARRRSLTSMHYLAFAFVLFAAFTTLWSPVPATTTVRSLLYLLMLLVALETSRIRWADAAVLSRDLILLFWLAVIVSALGLLLAIVGVPGMLGAYERFKGLTINSDVAAWIATIAFPIGYSRLFGETGRHRVWIIVGGSILAIAVVTSGTRGAMVALVGAIVVVHLLRVRSWIVGASIAGVILAASVVMLSGILPVGRVAEHSTDISSGRFGLWDMGIALWTRRPIGGWGFGSTSYLPGFANQDGMSLHNAYLSVLVETGAVGCVLFIALLIRLFVRWKARPESGIIAAAVAVLVNGVFESSLVNLGSPMTMEAWLVLGALFAAGGLSRVRDATEPTPKPIAGVSRLT